MNTNCFNFEKRIREWCKIIIQIIYNIFYDNYGFYYNINNKKRKVVNDRFSFVFLEFPSFSKLPCFV